MTNPLTFLQSITFIRIRVIFEAIEPIGLPEYKGSAFRGCLGESLRNQACTRPGLNCQKCKEQFVCPFSQLFNSYVPQEHEHQRKYPKSPHPYIIDPLAGTQTEFEPGETFGFDLTLIGSASKQLPLLLQTFGKMGETGIGKGRGQFKPVGLQALNADLNYETLPYFAQPEILSIGKLPVKALDKRVTIDLENPLRLKENGKLLLSAPGFGLLVERLAQRTGLLAHFYCGAPWPEPELDSIAEITNIPIEKSQLHEADWRRYSGTQDTTMNFDGLIGQITYRGEGINNWMPLLTLGSWLHVGSTATFGLGKYSIADH
jgi:hypothetical protein